MKKRTMSPTSRPFAMTLNGRALLFMMGLVLLTMGCGDPIFGPKDNSIHVTPETATLTAIGATVQFVATLNGERFGGFVVLQQALGVYEQHYAEAVRLLELMDREPSEIDEKEFDRLIRALLTSQTFHLESGALDGLLASGDIDVIRD